MYTLHILDDNEWLKLIDTEYTSYKKEYCPRAAAVTYLVYSGMSFVGYEGEYFPEQMADSYGNAFQVHQRPIKTAAIHKKWIRELNYFWYLLLVALPVDVYAHTYQFLLGEHDAILEGGAFFIPYMIAHWTLLLFTLLAPRVYYNLPSRYWIIYFKFIRINLVIHEYIYRLTLRKLTLWYRVCEFGIFVFAMYTLYGMFSDNHYQYQMISHDVSSTVLQIEE